MSQELNEKDWKLFRTKLPGWQEAYMDRLNKEYIELLSGESSAAEKFWQLDKRLSEDKRSAGVQMVMSRSKMELNILSLLYDGAITLDDLADFSEEFKERIRFIYERTNA